MLLLSDWGWLSLGDQRALGLMVLGDEVGMGTWLQCAVRVCGDGQRPPRLHTRLLNIFSIPSTNDKAEQLFVVDFTGSGGGGARIARTSSVEGLAGTGALLQPHALRNAASEYRPAPEFEGRGATFSKGKLGNNSFVVIKKQLDKDGDPQRARQIRVRSVSGVISLISPISNYSQIITHVTRNKNGILCVAH